MSNEIKFKNKKTITYTQEKSSHNFLKKKNKQTKYHTTKIITCSIIKNFFKKMIISVGTRFEHCS